MKEITVSSKGQIAIPKEVMASLHISGGDKLLLDIKEGKIILESAINVPRSQAWFWSEEWQKQVSQSIKDIEKGKVRVFKSVKEAKKHFGD